MFGRMLGGGLSIPESAAPILSDLAREKPHFCEEDRKLTVVELSYREAPTQERLRCRRQIFSDL